MAEDPYSVLRIHRGATQAEIRVAFLKLAKKYHPDLNPGDRKAEERFKRLNAAHAQLTMRNEDSDSNPPTAADLNEMRQPSEPASGGGFGAALSDLVSGVKTLFTK
ncbi:MAG: hypothetical protein B7Z75_11060 [Acidocella sp. 20-57-95]|nr:MAG: hypothetical protein B7Z75_11060 [Acidocella sp. 20-57-95]OYV58898.1 MAG: hypothetical protein B7Z71_09200 [Acidocella sp. 21-58-7]